MQYRWLRPGPGSLCGMAPLTGPPPLEFCLMSPAAPDLPHLLVPMLLEAGDVALRTRRRSRSRSRSRQAFVAQRRADASAAPTSAAEAGAAGWVLYWSSLVTA